MKKLRSESARSLKLKTQHSLEEIAELLAPESTQKEFEADDLVQGVVNSDTLTQFSDMTGQTGPFPFWDVVRINIFDALSQLSLPSAEIKLALETLDQNHATADETDTDWTLWMIRKKDAPSLCCVAPRSMINFDAETEVIADIDLTRLVENTKMSLRGV